MQAILLAISAVLFLLKPVLKTVSATMKPSQKQTSDQKEDIGYPHHQCCNTLLSLTVLPNLEAAEVGLCGANTPIFRAALTPDIAIVVE